MGEVYRATDLNLKRAVAVKVLPTAVSDDADRLARFRREAELLASLTHPNIAVVHGLETSDASGSGQTVPTALVMELVEGPTLADLIAARPSGLALGEALPIAKQIAHALEAAHEQGIVHRDLKPANVKVRPDGTVKVLDFGLAKALEPPAAMSAAMSMSPTLTARAVTQVSVILGTAAYVSPEQARGGSADTRADVWAFGCVCFEMFAGCAVFEGKTVSDVLAAVLRAEPEWHRLPALHPRLRLMLERCLTRDRQDRYQGVADARVDIEVAMEDPAGAGTGDRAAGGGHRERSPIRRWIALATAAAAGALLATLGAWLYASPDAVGPQAVRFEVPPPEGTLLAGYPVPFALSPDGRTVAFAARASDGAVRLWIRPLEADRAQPLQGTDGASSPFWSPDSEWVAFYSGGQLRKVRRSGGDPQTIVATPADGQAGSAWSSNGTILFKAGRFEAGWMGVSDRGGSPFEVTRLAKGETAHVWASFLPDGRRFVHRVWIEGGAGGIYLASLDGEPPRKLLESGANDRGAALVPGFLLFLRDGALIARRFDERRLEVLGDEVRLVEDIPACCGSWDPWSVSSGTLAFWRSELGFDSVLRWFARDDGSGSEPIGMPSRYAGLSLLPDDDRVAFSRYVGGARDVWLRDLRRGSETRLTFDGDSFSPVSSRNGMDIAFGSARRNTPDVYVTSSVGGTGDNARRVTALTNTVENPADWTSDGREVVYVTLNPDGRSDLRRVRLHDGKEEPLALSGPFNETSPRLSPDDRWIAYVTDAGGRHQVFVAAYPSGEHRVLVSNGPGSEPMWRSDGRELFYLSDRQELVAVPMVLTPSSASAGTPRVLFRVPDLVTLSEGSVYAPSRDGRRFLINVLAPGATQPPLQLILNWRALLADR
jgi:Tol biopolymer transport system component